MAASYVPIGPEDGGTALATAERGALFAGRLLAGLLLVSVVALGIVNGVFYVALRDHVRPIDDRVVAVLSNGSCIAEKGLRADGTIIILDSCVRPTDSDGKAEPVCPFGSGNTTYVMSNAWRTPSGLLLNATCTAVSGLGGGVPVPLPVSMGGTGDVGPYVGFNRLVLTDAAQRAYESNLRDIQLITTMTPATGDAMGNYPNIFIRPTGVVPGLYGGDWRCMLQADVLATGQVLNISCGNRSIVGVAGQVKIFFSGSNNDTLNIGTYQNTSYSSSVRYYALNLTTALPLASGGIGTNTRPGAAGRVVVTELTPAPAYVDSGIFLSDLVTYNATLTGVLAGSTMADPQLAPTGVVPGRIGNTTDCMADLDIGADGRVYGKHCLSLAALLNASAGTIVVGTPRQVTTTTLANGTVVLQLSQNFDATADVTLGTLTLTTAPLAWASGGTGTATSVVAANHLVVTGTGPDRLVETGVLLADVVTFTATVPGGDFVGSTYAALTLPTVNANTGTWGNATGWPVVTADGKGRVTALSQRTLVPRPNQTTLVDLGGGITQLGTVQDIGPLSAVVHGSLALTLAPLGLDSGGTGSSAFPLLGGARLMVSTPTSMVESSVQLTHVLLDTTAFASSDIAGTAAAGLFLQPTGVVPGIYGNSTDCILRAQLDAAGRIVDADCFSIVHLLVRNDTDVEIIIGTVNQVYATVVANGTVQLSLDQDLAPHSSVTFASLNLTTTPLSLASGGTGSSASPLVGLRLIQSNAGGTAMVESTIALSALITTSTPFVGGDLTGLAPALTLVPFGPGASTWGNTTAWPVVTTDTKGRVSAVALQPLVGYANQVVIVPGGSVGVPTVIKLPQDLAPSSWPTFLNVNCTTFVGGYLLYSSDKTIVESTLRVVDVLTNVTAIGAGSDLTGTYGTPLLATITTAQSLGPYHALSYNAKGLVTSGTNYSLVGGTGISVSTTGTTTTIAMSASVANASCLSTGVTVPASTTSDFQIDCNTPGSGWIDLPVQATVRGTGGNDPTFSTWRSPQRAYEFVGSSSEMREIFGQIHIPHTIKPGTGIYFHVHWVPSAASPSGNIVWKFDYSYAGPGNNQVFPASSTVTATATMPAQYTHMITEIAAPVLAGSLEVDGVISLRVYRDAADAGDTSTNSAFLLFIDAHIQVAKFATKNRNKAGGSFYT